MTDRIARLKELEADIERAKKALQDYTAKVLREGDPVTRGRKKSTVQSIIPDRCITVRFKDGTVLWTSEPGDLRIDIEALEAREAARRSVKSS